MMAVEGQVRFNQYDKFFSYRLGEWNQRSISSSISSVDTVMPPELSALPLISSVILSPSQSVITPHQALPLAAPEPRRQYRGLPVSSLKHSGAVKYVSGYRLMTTEGKMDHLLNTLSLAIKNRSGLQSPTFLLSRTSKDTTVIPPAPEKAAAHINPESYLRVALQPTKTVSEGKKTDSPWNMQRASRLILAKLPRPSSPKGGLDLSLRLLNSQDWKKKEEGLLKVQAMAQHHPEVLKTRLHDVCDAVIAEVNNLRSTVARTAMDTLAYLYVYLQRDMDTQVEHTGSALLLRIPGAVKVLQQHANKALDALVQSCSQHKVLKILLDPGLSHKCAAVRACAALQLHQLTDILGSDGILAEGTFTQSFVTAVRMICLDASAGVRSHGQTILRKLIHHRDFMRKWNYMIPEKDRGPLERIMRNARMT